MTEQNRAINTINLLKDHHKITLIYTHLSEDSHLEANFIVEGGLTMALDKKYSARFDRGLQPNQQDHLHVIKNGRDICVINKDGTPSHNSSIVLPNRIKDKIRKLNLVYLEESMLIETAGFNNGDEMRRLINIFWRIAQTGR